MRPLAALVGTLLAIGLMVPLRAQLVVTWGGGSGSWNNPLNWVLGAVPLLTEGAQVNTGSASIDTDVTVSRLLLAGGNIGGTANLTLSGTGSSWTAGSLNSTGTLTIGRGGSLEIATGNDHDFNGHAIVNQGIVTWTAGYLRTGSGGSITNASGATFTANADGYTVHVPGGYGGSALFNNLGTLAHTTGGTMVFDIPVNSSGSISVSDGVMVFRSGGTSSGMITTTGNGSLQFAASYALTDGSVLNGAIHATGGTLTATGNITVNGLSFEGAGLAGTQTFLGGTIDWINSSWNAAATTTLAPGTVLNIASGNDHDLNARTIVNRGTVNWTSGYLRGGSGSVFTNAAGGTFNDLNAGSYSLHVPGGFGGSFTFANEGTYRRTAGGTTYFDIPLVNSGAIDLQQGSLRFQAGGSFTATGTLTAAANTSVTFASDYTLTSGSALMGAGTYTLASGTLTVPTGTLTISTFNQEGGVLAGAPIINGLYNWNAGNWNAAPGATTAIASGSTLNIATGNNHDFNARSITNNGTVNWTAGYIRAGSGSVFTNATGGTFNDLNASSYSLHVPGGFGGSFSFVNQGTYRRDAGGTTYFDIPFTNSGSLELVQGNIEFHSGGVLDATGRFTTATGTNITFTNDYTIRNGSSLMGTGDYWLTGGTLSVTGALTTTRFTQNGGVLGGLTNSISGLYNWNGGNWNSAPAATTAIASGSTLNIGTGNDHDFNGRGITNNGTVNWTAGYIRAGSGSVFTNAAGATFNDLNAGSYSLHTPSGFGGAFSFVNDGTYRRTAGGTTYFDIPFNNNATVDLVQGSLEFRAGGVLSSTGTIAAAAETSVFFRNNYIIANGAALTGPGSYYLTGGTLTLSGAVAVGNFTQTDGVLAGTNAITGTYVWNGGNWNGAAGDTTTIASGGTLHLGAGASHDFNARAIVNQGNVSWTSGYIRAGSGSVLTNAATGTFTDRQTDGYSYHSPGGFGGSFSFLNQGTYLRSATGTTYFDIPLINAGVLHLTAGDIQLHAGGTMTGTSSVIADAGTHLYFTNDYTLQDGAQFSGPGLIDQVAGTLVIDGALRASSFLWSGGNWNSATNSGLTSTLAPGTTLNLSAAHDGARDFYGLTILNRGIVNWSSAYLRSGGGGSFTNDTGGVFHDLNTDGYALQNPFGGEFSFTNRGTYNRNAGGTTYFDVPFNNSGTLNLLVGDIQLRAGGLMSAGSSVNVAAGTHLYFVNDYSIATGSLFTGAGLVNQTAGRLTINGTLNAQAFLWSGGNWNTAADSGLVSTLDAKTVLNLTAAHDGARDFYGRTILNLGTTNWYSGYVRSGGGGSFTNGAGGVFNDLNADGYAVQNPFGGAFAFTNNGTYNRNASGTSYFDAPFNNNGALNVTVGDLQLRAGGLMSATSVVNVANGAHLYFTNDYSIATGSRFTGPGLVAQTAGKLAIDGTLTAQSFLWGGGNWNTAADSGLVSTIAPTTVLNLTAAYDGFRDFYGRTILNQGIANWSSAYLRSGGGGSFTNGAGGVFNDLNTDGYAIQNPFGGAFAFTNNGTYYRTVGGTTYFDVPYNNNGTLNVLAGDLQFRAGGTMSATSVVNVAAGARLYFTADYTLLTGARFAGAGLIAQTAGSLSANGTLTAQAFQWSGGNWNTAADSGLTTTIAAGSTLNISAAHDGFRDFYGRAIVNQGTVNWLSGYLRSGGGGTFTNAAGGTFNDLNTDGYTAHNPFGGAFTFKNEGSYLKTTGGTTTVQVPFVNSGRIVAQAGTLVFASSFTNNGGALVSTGGNFSFAQPLSLGTGSLTGTGTISASSVIAGGFVSPGNSPGQLTLTGDLTLLATSSLLIELAGTTKGVTYDFLSVGGAATLGGSLAVNFSGGFQATVSNADVFTVFSAASATGAFSNIANGQRLTTSDGLGSFVVNYGAGSAFGSANVVLTNFTPVPEPSTYALIGLGLVAIWCARPRKKQEKK